MKIIESQKLIDFYYEKYNLSDVFSNSMKPYIKLFMYDRKEHICTEHQKLDYIFLLVKGSTKVYTTLSNGRSLLMCFCTPINLFGELELVNATAKPSNVQVLEKSHCLGIHLKDVRENLLSDVKFLRYIGTSLGKKLDRFSVNSSINLLCELENRLASYLLATAMEVKRGNTTALVFDENLTHTAELLGASYRHLLRVLGTFCRCGFLVKKDKFYEIADRKALKELATDLYRKFD